LLLLDHFQRAELLQIVDLAGLICLAKAEACRLMQRIGISTSTSETNHHTCFRQ